MFLNFLIKKDDLRIYEPSYQGYKHNLCKIILSVFFSRKQRVILGEITHQKRIFLTHCTTDIILF